MSDELDSAAATPADTSTAAPDSPDSNVGAPIASEPQVGAADFAGDATPDEGFGSDEAFAKMFKLKPDSGQSADSKPDVPAQKAGVTDPPDSRPVTEVAKTSDKTVEGVPAEDTAPKTAEAKTDSQTEEPQDKPEDKLNWESAPQSFREAHDSLKKAYSAIQETAPQSQLISDPAGFTKWMEETSPTSFTEVTKDLATRSADAHPDKWAAYLAEKDPDAVAKAATGREDMTADLLKATLEVLMDDDDPDLVKALERQKALKADAAAAEPVETPEQKRFREWSEKQDIEEQRAVYSTVFEPIEKEVNELVSEAGLEIKPSDIEGKTFEQMDRDTQFKFMINELAPLWVGLRLKMRPDLQNMEARLTTFAKAKDVQSAKQLQHPARIAITNFMKEMLSLTTEFKAKSKVADTQIPSAQTPPPLVRSAGASNGRLPAAINGNGKGPIDWTVTEADL